MLLTWESFGRYELLGLYDRDRWKDEINASSNVVWKQWMNRAKQRLIPKDVPSR